MHRAINEYQMLEQPGHPYYLQNREKLQVTFHRNGLDNRLADGALTCHFVLENHTPQPEPQGRGREGN
jgi:hypothetical protein